MGLHACDYFRRYVNGESIDQDSSGQFLFTLTRDFISVQNTSGCETLKSKGLEYVRNDSLRGNIISLYEYYFRTLKKLEEEYEEIQFHKSYFMEIAEILSPYLIFNKGGGVIGLNEFPRLNIAERNEIMIFLWRIQANRKFIIGVYGEVEKSISQLDELIKKESSSR